MPFMLGRAIFCYSDKRLSSVRRRSRSEGLCSSWVAVPLVQLDARQLKEKKKISIFRPDTVSVEEPGVKNSFSSRLTWNQGK